MGKRPLLPEKRLPSPNAACLRRLCQPPWTHASRKESPPPHRRNHLRKHHTPQTPAALRERGAGGEALLSEKRLPSPNAACPRRLCQPPWTHASRKESPPPHRRNHLRKHQAPQTPAALRERGSGGEALLSEKRPLPQNLPRSTSLSQSLGNASVDVDEVDDLGDGGERP